MTETAGLPQWLKHFRGELLLPDQSGYDESRQIFNERLWGRPAVIARCAGLADVRLALRLARERGMEISVRSGGHHPAGWASNEGGLVVDLTALRWVRVDPASSTAWVGGGALAGDVLQEATQFGLAPVTGVYPEIGIAGLILGAGEGYLAPRYGFGSDQILEVELVTADGTVMTASAEENPDLFWAVRGAGQNFGVVTALKLRLHPAPRRAVGGYLDFHAGDALEVSRHIWDMMENASEFFYPEVSYGLDEQGQLQIRVLPGHTGPEDVAERELAALRGCAPVARDETRVMSYVDLAHDRTDTFGDPTPRRVSWDNYRFEFGVDAERQIETLLGLAPTLLPSTGWVFWRTVPRTVPTPPSALPRLPGLSICLLASWEEEAADETHLRWVAEAAATLKDAGVVKDATGSINHTDTLDGERVRALYGEESFQRLAQLKAKYDPDNTFHHNYNIPPA